MGLRGKRIAAATFVVAAAFGGYVAAREPAPLASAGVLGGADIRMAVLGDSYTSGDGAGDYADGVDCHRSQHAYGRQAADLLRGGGEHVTVDFRPCTGAVIDEIRDQIHHQWPSERGAEAPPDIPISSANLVLMTAGGNDAHFADRAAQCVVDCHVIDAANDSFVIEANLVKLYADVRAAMAPTGRLLVDQQCGADAGGCVWLQPLTAASSPAPAG